MTLCRDCEREIIFAVTEKGRRMPLDPERRAPDDLTATLAVYRDHLRVRVRVISTERPLQSFEWRAMPHAATCPPRVAARDAQAGRIPNVIPLRGRGSRRA